MASAMVRISRESLPAPVFIWRQWPVGYDVLTNVAIVVMRLVWLAPASVEQSNARRHARSLSGLLALGNAHQRVDGCDRVNTGRA
jgi:hypothetical protein